jgi:hypothetical protein
MLPIWWFICTPNTHTIKNRVFYYSSCRPKVIGQGAQAAIELSYEHFPKATEKTLDLIAKVGTQVGNGLDVTVKYIDEYLFLYFRRHLFSGLFLVHRYILLLFFYFLTTAHLLLQYFLELYHYYPLIIFYFCSYQ